MFVVLSAGLGLAPSAEATGSGMITGKVTNVFAIAIGGIEVCAYEKSFENPLGACAKTNAEGQYTLSGLSKGEYTIEFLSPPESGLDYVAQYYSGRSSYSAANLVVVGEGETTKEIDAQLKEGGSIAGRVTDASTGTPIAGILACAFPRQENELGEGCAMTNAGGEYTVSALPGGEYVVGFQSSFGGNLNYVTQYYQGKPSPELANLVTVTVGETRREINAALSPGGQITGTVTSAATGAKLEGIFVCALSVSPGNAAAGCEFTEANGTYTLRSLPSGEYKVQFRGGTRYLRQYYNDQYTLAEAQVVSVTAGALTTGIDAAMELGPAAAPVDAVPPTVSGTAAVGSTLSCANGSWTGAPAPRFAYIWLDDGVAIAGGNSYTVQETDEGHTISCEVIATNLAGQARATSAGVVVASASPPVPRANIAAAKVRVSGRTVSVRVRCRNAPCRGTAELTVPVTVRSHKGKRIVSRRTTLVLARGSFSLAEGQAGLVVMHLTAAGRKRLAQAKRHPLTVKLTLLLRDGKTTSRKVLAS